MEQMLEHFITDAILRYGYLAVFLLMVAESALIPIPSEVTMLFGGALANEALVSHLGASGEPLNFWVVGMLGTLGNLVGSWIAYGIGRTGGRALAERWGRYVLIRHHHIDVAERWFDRHGNAAVFFGRLLPVIRTFISLPAGIAEMSLTRFTIYTFIGCLPWTYALAWGGHFLGGRWEIVVPWFRPVTILVAVLCLAGAAWWVWKSLSERRYSDT